MKATRRPASVSTRNGLRKLGPGHAVGYGLEPLHRLGAEDESDVPCGYLVTPTGHGSCRDFGIVEEDPRRLRRLEAQRDHVEKQRPAPGRAYERPAREIGEQ